MWYTVCYPVSLNQEFYLYSYVESSVLSFRLFISVTVLTAEDSLRSIESSNLWPPLTFKLCWGNETRRLQNRSCAEPLQELEKWPRIPNNVSSVFLMQVFKGSWLSSNTLQQSRQFWAHTFFLEKILIMREATETIWIATSTSMSYLFYIEMSLCVVSHRESTLRTMQINDIYYYYYTLWLLPLLHTISFCYFTWYSIHFVYQVNQLINTCF